MSKLEQKLAAIPLDMLRSMNHGIEKESLRVKPDYLLSERSHPPVLGSALTHPLITTDFSESQLELVTGVHSSIDATLDELERTHKFVYQNIGDELLWATSMPCRLPDDDLIPIGQYGTSNVGRSKTVYRKGLGYRYGRRMQTISGVHYNFSMPESVWPLLQEFESGRPVVRDVQTTGYFSLIRNFKRHSWLLLYLFGASPAVCGTFVNDREHRLQPIGKGSMHLPYGTSMRMGPLGYQSRAQDSLNASCNTLAGYASSLHKGLTEPYPPYEAIGICHEGEYRQLSTTLLQIENEYYGAIRPKRRIQSGERALRALGERGVEYVEVRCLDIDPFAPLGISAITASFLDVFLLHCLLSDSPLDTGESLAVDARNQLLVAERGRDPSLRLTHTDGREIGIIEWGSQLIDQCRGIAECLDSANGKEQRFVQSLESARVKINDPNQTPSARILREMASNWDNSCPDFSLHQSQKHRLRCLEEPLEAEENSRFIRLADESIKKQRDIEDSDTIDFETYRKNYVAQDLTCCS